MRVKQAAVKGERHVVRKIVVDGCVGQGAVFAGGVGGAHDLTPDPALAVVAVRPQHRRHRAPLDPPQQKLSTSGVCGVVIAGATLAVVEAYMRVKLGGRG